MGTRLAVSLPNDERAEWLRCYHSPAYFLCHYVYIYDATALEWLKFELWSAQVGALQEMVSASKLVILKARQLGISWSDLVYMMRESGIGNR